MRAGDKSLHPAWLAGSGEKRSWDLHISYYGDAAEPFEDRPYDVTLSHERGLKFLGLADCLDKLDGRLGDYDYIGFADDDLWAERRTWNRLFEVVRQYRPVLAQPALHPRSFFSFPELLAQPRFILRWTNFVEEQAPVFSASALTRVRKDFRANQSGWGLDVLWARDLAGEKALCVVDAAPVLHTRALYTGPLYRLLEDQGAPTPREEMAILLAQHGLKREPLRVLGAVSRDGQDLDCPVMAKGPVLAARWRRKWRLMRGIRAVAPPED